VARTMDRNFVLQGVAPGEYALLALDGGDRLEYANPEVLGPYLSNAEHVTVRAHGNVVASVGLTSAGK